MRVTPLELAEWVALYNAGKSLRAIAEHAGRDHKAISYAFNRHGIQIRRDQPHTRARVGWCDECCDEKTLNPRTGWCLVCTARNHPSFTTAPSTIMDP